MLFGAINGEAFLWGFAEAAPRPRLSLLALGVTSSPPRRPKSAWRAQPCISRSASPTIICRSNFSLQFPLWNILYRSCIHGRPCGSEKDQVGRTHEVSPTTWDTADARVESQHVTTRRDGRNSPLPLTTTTEGPRHSTTTARTMNVSIFRANPPTLALCSRIALHPKVLFRLADSLGV